MPSYFASCFFSKKFKDLSVKSKITEQTIIHLFSFYYVNAPMWNVYFSVIALCLYRTLSLIDWYSQIRCFYLSNQVNFNLLDLVTIEENIVLSNLYPYSLYFPVSTLHKSIAGRYRPVRVADGPRTASCRFIKNASWVQMIVIYLHSNVKTFPVNMLNQLKHRNIYQAKIIHFLENKSSVDKIS